MMRLKLIGAVRSSFRGAPRTILRNETVDVDDNVGQMLMERFFMDTAGQKRPMWELVETTDGDSAASLEEAAEEEVDAPDAPEEAEEEVEEEEVEEEEETPPPAPKKKASPKRRAAPKKARTRKPAAT